MTLQDQLYDYCRERNFPISPCILESIDFVVEMGADKIGVMLRDWNRALGFNVVIYAEQLKKRYKEFSQVVILTNSCSDPAQTLADKIGIPLIKHWELLPQTRSR